MANYDMTALGTRTEVQSIGRDHNFIARLSDNRVVIAWKGTDGDGFVQAFDVTNAGVYTALSSALEFDTDTASFMSIMPIDATNFAMAWQGTASDGFVQLFICNAGTGAITTNGSSLEFDTTYAGYINIDQLDSTHFLLTYQDASAAGGHASRAYSFNTGTGAITALGSKFSVGTLRYSFSTAVISSSKVVVAYAGSSDEDMKLIVLSINNSTWAVSAAGTELVTASTANSPCVEYMYTSGSNAVIVVNWHNGTEQRWRSYNINTTTWAITAFGSELDENNTSTNILSKRFVERYDNTHFVSLTNDSVIGDPIVSSYELNTTTGAITRLDTTVIGAGGIGGTDGGYFCLTLMNTVYFAGTWGSNNDAGIETQLFRLVLAVDYPLTAAQGTFTLTGQASLFKLGRVLLAALGTYTLTGQTTILSLGRKMIAALGTYTLSGQAAVMRAGKMLIAALGSYTLTGQTATLNAFRTMIAAVGSYTLTGFAFILAVGHTLLASMGTITLTGQTMLTSLAKTMVAAYGTFALTGQAATFMTARLLNAVVGLFTLTGNVVRFLRNGTSTQLINQDKVAAGLTNSDKQSAGLTNSSKQSASLTNSDKI